MIGNTVRLGMRMGLHRDSSKIGGSITSFQGEMRRRMWHHLMQVDLLSSIHIGLPGVTQGLDSDTQYPSNLRDEDFDEDSVELPPSRPDSELTPMSYTICKSRLCKVAGKIAAMANRLSTGRYEDIMALDKELNTAHSQVPKWFQLNPSQGFVTDPPERVVKRFSIAQLYQRSRCMLHRSFMLKGNESQNHAYSKAAGLAAAMELLRCQAMVYEAALPGGPLSRDLWFLSSLATHDFLLAAMIIYINVTRSIEDGALLTRGDNIQEMLQALDKSCYIWSQSQMTLPEAKSAFNVLAIMMTRSRSVYAEHAPPGSLQLPNGVNSIIGRSNTFSSELAFNGHMDSSITPQFTHDLPTVWPAGSSNNTPSSSLSIPFDFDPSTTNIDPFDKFINVPDNFDWEMFDNNLRPPEMPNETWPDLDQDIWDGYNEYAQ